MRLAACALVVLAAGCPGKYPAEPRPPDGHGIEAAALPYSIVEGRSGKAVADTDFWAAVGAARIICVGEDHTNPHHHWAQLEILDRLADRRDGGLALGMEMVQRPFQAVLDDFAAGRIDEAAMLSRVGWADRWSHDFAMYRPVVRRAVEDGAALIALNAARELTKKVVRQGLDALSPEERAQLPRELVLDDAEHRAWWDSVMAAMGGAEGHGHGHGQGEPGEKDAPPEDPVEARGELQPPPPSADQVYMVQVIWDETMAETAASWVGGDAGADRTMVVIAGNGHCHDSGIVRRIQRRGVEPTVSVRPIIDDGAGNVAEAIQERRHDYLFVMSMPTGE